MFFHRRASDLASLVRQADVGFGCRRREREREKISHADCGRSKKGRKNLQTSGMRGGENTEQLSSFFTNTFCENQGSFCLCVRYTFTLTFRPMQVHLGPGRSNVEERGSCLPLGEDFVGRIIITARATDSLGVLRLTVCLLLFMTYTYV